MKIFVDCKIKKGSLVKITKTDHRDAARAGLGLVMEVEEDAYQKTLFPSFDVYSFKTSTMERYYAYNLELINLPA